MPRLGPALGWGQLDGRLEQEPQSTGGMGWAGTGQRVSHCPDAVCPALPQDRVPFVVAERVPWEKMCDTLNLKFKAEVQTTKGLLKEHYFFLAQKIFNDHSASLEDFQSRSVSWAQFNKVTGRDGQGGQGPAWPWGASHSLSLCPRRSCPVGDSRSGSGLMESLTSPRDASKVTGQTGGCPEAK